MEEKNTNEETKIAERIADLRKAVGLTQEELAQKAGLTKDYIGLIERGKHTNLTMQTISALADALGVHPTVILYGSMFSPNTTFLQGTFIDPNNPLDVTELVKKVEELFPLSKDEKELLSCYRDINNPKEKKMAKEMVKALAGK